MQEIASLHADKLHFGYDDMTAKGLLWVLSRAKLVMHEYPKTWEEITVETWPKNIVKLFANRDFRFYNQSGKVIGSATTAWLMLNRENFRPVNPAAHLQDLQKVEVPPGLDEFLEKIEEPESLLPMGNYKISYKDIDINKHTNNSRYIEYLLDCFDEKLTSGNTISSIQVNFLNQTKSGDELFLFKNGSEGQTDVDYIEAVNQYNEKVFNSKIEWI